MTPLGDLLTAAMSSVPGSFGFAQQLSIFGRGVGGTNAVDVEMFSSDMDSLRSHSAEALHRNLTGTYGYERCPACPVEL